MRALHTTLASMMLFSALVLPALGGPAYPQAEFGEPAEEAPPPLSPEEAAAHEAKARRYDAGGPDLTAPPDVGEDGEREQFIEQIWPRVDPQTESALVVLGTVVARQPYLSH